MAKYGWNDLYPQPSDPVPATDWNGFGPAVWPCRVCGAAVFLSTRETHLDWHNGT